ncbi:hypothetical protein ACVWYF_001948 [Hymenobacter sp. UYAg731]
MPATGSLVDFRLAYFGPYDHYMGWHDGYDADLTVLDALSPADRLTAEAELCADLRTGLADPRVPIGLGHLRTAAALPLLHANLGRLGMYALQAIAHIDPAALDADQVLALLRSPRLTEYQLFEIVIGLGAFFTLAQLDPRLPTQLLALLANRHFLVRTHALTALRRLYHLPDPKEGDGSVITRADVLRDELFGLISTDKRPADFSRAQALFQAQVAGIRPAPPSGASPA